MDFESYYFRRLMMLEGFTFQPRRECELLTLSKPNAKIAFWQLSLPAGYTCPFAKECMSKADKITGKLTEPDKTEHGHRCYAASQEAIYPNARKSRHNNFDLMLTKKTRSDMSKLIIDSLDAGLPRKEGIFRLHASGDFYNQTYFDAWIDVAKHFKDIGFYGYTKSLPYWIKSKSQIPENFILTASKGSSQDDLIDKHHLKFCDVVGSIEEADNYQLTSYWKKKLGRDKGLPIDHDDSHAYINDHPFALLLHGIQPKGSKAAEDLKKLGGMAGISSYSKNK